MQRSLMVLALVASGAAAAMAAELIGFDIDNGSGSPTNWNSGLLGQATTSSQTFSNLLDESGAATGVDLTIENFRALNLGLAAPNTATVPQHSTVLDAINDYAFSSSGVPATLTATFSDLAPGNSYYLWVFGLRRFDSRNTIAVAGAETFAYTQQFAANDLFINDEVGSDTRTLASYADVVVADSNGQIKVTAGTDTSYAYAIGGYAIQLVPEPGTALLSLVAAGALLRRRGC